jgi:hypothetical protein
LNYHEVRPLWILRIESYAMVAPRLLCHCWYWAEAVFAEPHSGSRRARGNAANAQQLQHGLAPGQARRQAILLFGLPIGFLRHRHSPRQIAIR